ncbi:hypothetical protein B0H17DRAFT_1135815 [Mycena rosella]|uniref:Uncharacterized protein n=1 Tax=Mycena rosella TaxID=1033263 RepID=A0AAD7DC42_MYCRO|nr:hypothetical protein B0H17DRAFT_1135815 [Mycena rosella]
MSHPSSVPLLPAREGEVLRRRDATLPVDFPGSDAAFAAGAAVGPCNTSILLSSNHRDGMDSVGGTTDVATGAEVFRRCSSTLTVDFPEAGPVVYIANTFQEGDRLLSGEVLHSDCSTVDLLPLYLADRDPLAADDPTTDMDAMHPRHALLPSRRSARIRGLASAEAQRNLTLCSTPMPAKRPRPPQDADTISTPPTKKWLDSRGQLVTPEASWRCIVLDRPLVSPHQGPVTLSPAKAAPKQARVGNLAVTTDVPESNDAPEVPNANALLPTAFNLLRQIGVNPSAIKGEPSATNVVDKAGFEAHDIVLGAKYDLQALTKNHERVDTGPSGPARVEEHKPMSGYVKNSGYCFGKN